jgi:cell division protein FtsB
MHRPRRRLPLALAALALAIAVAGCGGGDDTNASLAQALGGDEAGFSVRAAQVLQEHAQELTAASSEVSAASADPAAQQEALDRLADIAEAIAADIQDLDAEGAAVALREQMAGSFTQLATQARSATDADAAAAAAAALSSSIDVAP